MYQYLQLPKGTNYNNITYTFLHNLSCSTEMHFKSLSPRQKQINAKFARQAWETDNKYHDMNTMRVQSAVTKCFPFNI